VTDPAVDVFDREAVFIERVLAPLVRELPGLRLVFEHITTAQAVDFVESAGEHVAATVTPQHLHINRNAMFAGGLRPHAYCLPVAKREVHRLALRKAVTGGSQSYFLGTDSAPHAVSAKESGCGCAGIFNAPHALESYAQVFEDEGVLDRFEAFASVNGPRFYGLPLNPGMVTLRREANPVPDRIDASGMPIVPFHAGETLAWRFVG
jgi:dihydroorotase